MKLPNIEYKGDITKYIQAEDNPFDNISFYKDIEYFADEVSYTRFVKEVEKLVRTSKEYSAFISYIKNILGVNFCQVSSKICDSDATIEMHHGPIFTLYDICSTILNYYLKVGKKINTFRIANSVIDEHYALRVQVVMMAVTNHEAIKNRDLYLNVHQGIGDVNAFIKMYANCFDDVQKYKIYQYIQMSKNNPSFDTGILDIDNVEKMINI